MTVTIQETSVGTQTDPARGPLGSLYSVSNGIEIMRYPRNLNSLERGHTVLFTARKIKPMKIEDIQKLSGTFVDKFEEVGSLATGATIDFGQGNVGAGLGKIAGAGAKSLSGIANLVKPKYNDETTEIKAQISLYMPETLNFQYQATYNEMRLLEAAASVPLVGKIASGIESILENKASRVLMNRAGYIFNPQQQLLFEGIDFRHFQMAFTFTPVSKDEAVVVNNIIKTFRKYTAPEFIQDVGGMFFRPPAVFDIQFFFNGQENTNINKLTTCVIDSIDVNYAPNGWAAHQDGAPIQTTMTMNFKETALVDRGMIENGY